VRKARPILRERLDARLAAAKIATPDGLEGGIVKIDGTKG
jgi:hypothetical protein